MCKEYNGWTNWQSWNVGTWLGSHDSGLSFVNHVLDNQELNDMQRAESIKLYVQAEIARTMPGLPGLASDLVANALNGVDWQEVINLYRG